MNLRSLIPVVLSAHFLGGVAGCKKEAPTAQPEPEATASNLANAKLRPPPRMPLGPVPKIDPQAMKDYRLDICYYGTLTLRQARDSYLASLGKDEPSAKKIPNFGVPGAPPGGATAPRSGATPAPMTAGAKGSATPQGAPAVPGLKPLTPLAGKPSSAPVAAAPAKPGASVGGAPMAAPLTPAPLSERRPFDFALRAPHERNARACTAALALKDTEMGDVDTALGAFAPFAVELARDITAANSYYQREEYKKDNFVKGIELHKQLLEAWKRLDDLEDKLGLALTAWRKAHPVDASKQDEGEKLAYATIDEARDVLLAVLPKKIEGLPARVDKLDHSVTALKEFSASHSSDSWTKIVLGPLDAFVKAAKDAKLTPNGIEAESFLALVNNFTNLIEARQRAISRSMILKGQTMNPMPNQNMQPAGRPMPSPAPATNPAQ